MGAKSQERIECTWSGALGGLKDLEAEVGEDWETTGWGADRRVWQSHTGAGLEIETGAKSPERIECTWSGAWRGLEGRRV